MLYDPEAWEMTLPGEQLHAAVQSVRNVVNGLWLNIPTGGKYCPRCGEPHSEVAAGLLQMLGAQ